MSDLSASIASLRAFDELAARQSPVHSLHAAVQFLTTIAYVVTLASFDRMAFFRLVPLILYPFLLFLWSDLPARPILRRLAVVEPLIIGIGLFNPLLDRQMILIAGLPVARGWITLAAILLKGALAVTAALLLIAATGMNRLAAAMRSLHVPRLFVLVFFLTFRYIGVLGEELARILRAYSLRAPGSEAVRRQAWGSLLGQLLLRAFARAERIYTAMELRGFKGEYTLGHTRRLRLADLGWLLGWIGFFLFCRLVDIPAAAAAFWGVLLT